MSLQFDGWANSYKRVEVEVPDKNVAAGAFKMKGTGTLDALTVFCLDLLAVIRGGVTYGYEVTDTPFTNGGVDLSENGGVDRIQKIFDSSYETALDSSVTSAGFQVALWNAVYDDDWSVTAGAGDFYQTGGNADALNEANRVLSVADLYGGGKKWDLSFLESTETPIRSQNLVTASPALNNEDPSPVPLPAAGVMLLTALGGLMIGRRRKVA